MERDLEARVVELLAPIVGSDGVRSKVSVELDTRRVTETSETFDPERTAVRREQRQEESSTMGARNEAGVAGVAGQLGGAAPAAGAQASEKTNEIIDYEINKSVRQTMTGGVSIKRLSVAVLVDEARIGAGAEGGAQAGDEEMQRRQALVASAVGLDTERGDQLQLMRRAFSAAATPEPIEELPFWQEPTFLASAVRWGVIGLVCMLLLLVVVRPLWRDLRASRRPSEPKGLLAAEGAQPSEAPAALRASVVGRTVAELEGDLEQAAQFELVGDQDGLALLATPADPLREHQIQLRDEALALASEDLERTSQVISQWIRVGQESKSVLH